MDKSILYPSMSQLLIGNSFPLSLIRRQVIITPMEKAELKAVLQTTNGICSFWGHQNTLSCVNQWLGYDLTPSTARPCLSLSEHQLPFMDGCEYHDCYVISPNYRAGFRPAIGEEVPAEAICNWQILHLCW